MKTKDFFIEWVREKILNNPQEPSADSWEEISNALDLEESWEQIGEELELNEVWEKVDTRLGRYDHLETIEKWTNRFSMAAVFLLLIIPVLQNPFSEKRSEAERELQKPALSLESEESGQNFQPASSGAVSMGSSLKSLKIIESKNQEKEYSLSKEKKETIAFSGEDKTKKFKGTAGSVLQTGKEVDGFRKRKKEADFHRLIPLGHTLDVRDSLFSVDVEGVALLEEERKEDKSAKASGLYVGVGTALKLNWLLNNKTLYAMERNSLMKAKPSIQKDYNFLFGLPLSNKIIVQAEFYWQDMVGQSYEEYREGNYGRVEDVLRYQSMSLNFSWLRREWGYGKSFHYARLLAGIYGGRLLRAEERTESGRLEKTNEYDRYRLGLLSGLEYDTSINDRFFITYGLRSRLDLLNIFSGSESMPAAFEKTRSASLDFTIALKYKINK